MCAAAEHAGVVALVGHEFRWAPDRALAARALAGGAIGEPRLATLVQYVPLVADPDARVPEWWFDETRGGGWLGASGSHIVDQVRTWFGEIASVSAMLPTVARRDAAEDSFVVRLTTESGVEAVLQQTAASWTPGVVGMTVVAGTDGTLEVTADGVCVSDRSGRRLLPVPDDLALPAAPARATIPAIGTRTSSSVRTRGCARRCWRGCDGARCSVAGCRCRRSPTASRACACSTRSARRPDREVRGSTSGSSYHALPYRSRCVCCANGLAAGRAERSGRAGRSGRPRPGRRGSGSASSSLQLGAVRRGDRRRARCRARARSPRAAGSAPRGRSTSRSSPRGRVRCRRTRRCAPARPRCRRSRPCRRRRAAWA